LHSFPLKKLTKKSSVTALLHQYIAYSTFTHHSTPAPLIRTFGHQLITILSPPFLLDLSTSILNPFIGNASSFGGGYYARKLYVCAMAFRLAYMMTWGAANKLRGVLHDTSKTDDELRDAMQAFVRLNDWRLWVVTAPGWVVTVAATVAWVSGA
jgi:hypothetical protein